MKNYVITNESLYVFNYALKEIIKWNNNEKLNLIAYDSFNHKKHMLLLHGLCDTYNNIFPTMSYFEHNRFDHGFINEVNFENNTILAVQYIEKKPTDRLLISENNLYDFFGINKKIILFELFSKFNSDNNLVSQIDSITIDFINKIKSNT